SSPVVCCARGTGQRGVRGAALRGSPTARPAIQANPERVRYRCRFQGAVRVTMDPVHQPHDALFKFVFGEGDLEPCRELLARALPAAISSAIDWSTLARADEDLRDPDLSERETDLLLTATMADQQVYLYVLADHKSWDDPETLLQLFGYMARIWRRHRSRHGKRSKLPFILPFVPHHGIARWASPRR